jgi:hypothetical protein
MSDRKIMLELKADGESIFQVSLNTYLNSLRLVEESWVKSFQEYLDREDNFRMLVYLNNTSGSDNGWASFRITINDWIVRDQGTTIE